MIVHLGLEGTLVKTVFEDIGEAEFLLMENSSAYYTGVEFKVGTNGEPVTVMFSGPTGNFRQAVSWARVRIKDARESYLRARRSADGK